MEVRREKVRRVRVAALTVEGEGCRGSCLGEWAEEGEVGAVAFSCGLLRGRRIETKFGRAIVDEWGGEDR